MKQLIILLFTFSFAAIINIPDDYTYIQEGIDAAAENDTIFVAEGTYSPSTNGETFPITMKSHLNLIGSGEEITIIDAEQTGRVMILEDCTNNTISDFTITGGLAEGGSPSNRGGGMYLHFSHPTLTHVTISGNTAGYGGGMYLFSSNLTLTHVTISGNIADYGGGMYLLVSYPTLTHLTVSENTADVGGGMYLHFSHPILTHMTISGNTAGYGGGMNLYSSSPTLINSIIWNNNPQSISFYSSGIPIINYSDIEGGWEGEGNINADPLFTIPENDDYTLQEGSPCIDSGIADLDGDGVEDITDYFGSAPDMGAFEWMGVVLGDLNEDGETNIQDIIFEVNIILENIFSTENQLWSGDLNGDNVIDIYDIILLINIILE